MSSIFSDLPDVPYKLVDIGANLQHKSFNNKELENVIERAKAAGVFKIMVTGTSVQGSQESLRLSRLYPGFLYSTAGVHPHDAKHFDAETLGKLESLASEPECVAIGECGLDFNRNFSPQEDQLSAFESQVQLACKLKKPLFIHEREASADMVRILTKYKETLPPAVIHCFTGTIEEAKTYFNMGLYVGLTGFLWKDKAENGVQADLKAKDFPLERLMVETDSPFMFPKVDNKKLPLEIREKISEHAKNFLFKYCSFHRNEPCSLAATTELIAAFMSVPASEVAFNTTVNAVKVFGLDR